MMRQLRRRRRSVTIISRLTTMDGGIDIIILRAARARHARCQRALRALKQQRALMILLFFAMMSDFSLLY